MRRVAALDRDAVAPVVVELRDRIGGGAEDFEVGVVGEASRVGLCGGLDVLALAADDAEVREPHVRRPAQRFAIGEFFFCKAGVVVRRGKANRRVLRAIGLNERFSGTRAATAPADLREQPEGAFGRAEIGDVKIQIGRDRADKRDLWKIKALCDHLRAHEKIAFGDKAVE